jgi:hypothetical protein
MDFWAVEAYRQTPTIGKNVTKGLSHPKMEAVCSTETLISTYKFVWHYNPEENT